MGTGYTKERAATHDAELIRVMAILQERGWEPTALEVDGHRPDIRICTGDYLDVKTGGPNLAIEITCIIEADHIRATEKKNVYYLHSIDGQVWVVDRTTMKPLSGPQRPTGNGSNDSWYLFEPGSTCGTEFDKFFFKRQPKPPRVPPGTRAQDLI
jgi:hypothetical protein